MKTEAKIARKRQQLTNELNNAYKENNTLLVLSLENQLKMLNWVLVHED